MLQVPDISHSTVEFLSPWDTLNIGGSPTNREIHAQAVYEILDWENENKNVLKVWSWGDVRRILKDLKRCLDYDIINVCHFFTRVLNALDQANVLLPEHYRVDALKHDIANISFIQTHYGYIDIDFPWILPLEQYDTWSPISYAKEKYDTALKEFFLQGQELIYLDWDSYFFHLSDIIKDKNIDSENWIDELLKLISTWDSGKNL